MLRHDNLLRAGIAICAVGAILCFGVAACALQPNQVTGHAVAAPMMPDIPGCAEIDIDSEQRGVLGANGAVNEIAAHTVVNYSHVGAGSHIGITGEGSCLWIAGNIGPNVAISVTGPGSGIVIKGSIDPSVRIDAGAGMVTWIPLLTTTSELHGAPDLRISDEDGGLLIINGMEEQ